jgi:hypothetical protein
MPRRLQPHLGLVLVLFLAVQWPAAQAPVPAAAQECSDEAELIAQTLDPAVTVFVPDEAFTVDWTVRNRGDCTWDRNYRLIFISGDRMDSTRTARLRSTVEPGETLTLSLDLAAPAEPGDYRGVWRLRNPAGVNFGPELEVAIQVGEESSGAQTDVVLPEVLAFGGKGGGGGSGEDLVFCLDQGALPESPTIIAYEEGLQYRYTTLFVCSLPEDVAVTVQATNPDGDTFTRDFTQNAPVTYTDEEGNEYTGTVVPISLSWPERAPTGAWTVTVTGEDIQLETVLDVPEPLPPWGDEPYPMLDNWPVSPIDPFAAAEGCHYVYTPGQAMRIGGSALPPDATLRLGLYQERMGEGYLVDDETVTTGGEGVFEAPYTAPGPGEYQLVVLQRVDPAGFEDNGTVYMFGVGDDGDSTAWSCLTVQAEVTDQTPLRLAFASYTPEGEYTGSGGNDVIMVQFPEGAGYYPTWMYGQCDSGEPAWWPDDEWIVYHSNCVAEQDDSGLTTYLPGTDYDLYAHQVDMEFVLTEEESLSRLTFTPDVDETDPDVSPDGLIVYREAPAGTPLDASGEIRVLDIFSETVTSLGLTGRAPAWSPDGNRIALMSDLEGTWQVYVYDLAEDEIWLASQNCPSHCRFPAWSPDGRQILFSITAAEDNLTSDGLWTVPAAGGRPRRWLSGPYDRPTWSGEGQIAFTGPGGLYLAEAGRSPTPVRYLYRDPALGVYSAPVWSR